MNINSQINSLPLATVVNPPTESLRRENNLREITPPPAAPTPSAAEQGVANGDEQGTSYQPNTDQVITSAEKHPSSKEANESNNSIENSTEQSPTSKEDKNNNTPFSGKQKSQHLAEQQQISALQKRDQEVRTHELAHTAVGGLVTGAPSFSFQRGPDGKDYAVSGEVSVDLSTVAGDPRATIAKMKKVHAAALAPIAPSAQDKQVAAAAAQTIAAAQSEILNSDLSSSSNQSRVKQSLQSDAENQVGQAQKSTNSSDDFDAFINSTLKSQDNAAPEISKDVQQRALRIESFYSNINLAYSKPSNPQVQLTA